LALPVNDSADGSARFHRSVNLLSSWSFYPYPALPENRPLRKYDNGKGEWTFYLDRDDVLLQEVASACDFIEGLAMGDEIVVGNYSSRVRDRFLKQFTANGTRA